MVWNQLLAAQVCLPCSRSDVHIDVTVCKPVVTTEHARKRQLWQGMFGSTEAFCSHGRKRSAGTGRKYQAPHRPPSCHIMKGLM